MDRALFRFCGLAVCLTAIVGSTGQAQAQACTQTGTNQTCTNSVFLNNAAAAGISDTNTVTVTNTATGTIGILGTGQNGIETIAGAANVTNNGAIAGATAILGHTDAVVTNTGTISGNTTAISALTGKATIDNSGSISSAGITITGQTGISLTNSGTVTSTAGAALVSSGNIGVTNSGTISSNSFTIFGNGNITVANTGTISGRNAGIFANSGTSTLNVTNSGLISTNNGITIGGNGTTVNVVNSGTIRDTGTGTAIVTSKNLNLSNSGTVTGFSGVTATNLTLNNTGTISGTNVGIIQNGTGNIFNAGTISSTNFALIASNGASVTNTGAITGGVRGLSANGGGTFVNSGSITGGQFAFSSNSGSASLTNSGTISSPQTAILFAGSNDLLTLQAGSRIIGAIQLGTADTVNFAGGNHNLTFNSLTGATVTGTTPFAVSGNQAAAIDTTPFAAQGRTLNDFSREAAGAIPLIPAGTSPGSGPLAYAAPDPSSRVNDAFAAIPGVVAGANDAMVFKNPTVVYEDGSAVWARGFAGQRIQQADGPLFRTANLFYGGMIGGDIRVRPDLRIGVFAGVGQTRTSIDFSGGLNSDVTFGGLYAQYDAGATFLRAVLQAGGSNNFTTRTINNNLVAGGLETATASFNGWYINPELTIGQRVGLGNLAGGSYTLTPTLRLRYLYGSYDGYTENGSTANLTMGSRSVSTVEERGELKLTRTVTFSPSSQLASSIYGGFLGTQRAGDSAINAALLGQAIPFAAPGPANVWGGFGGLGLEWRTRNVTLFSTAEYLALSDNSALVSGRAGLRVGF